MAEEKVRGNEEIGEGEREDGGKGRREGYRGEDME